MGRVGWVRGEWRGEDAGLIQAFFGWGGGAWVSNEFNAGSDHFLSFTFHPSPFFHNFFHFCHLFHAMLVKDSFSLCACV